MSYPTTQTASFDIYYADMEGADIVSLSHGELAETDGGIIPILIGMAIGVTVAHYISTH
jgi:lactobin A/cerein 7B family class IIb bacteriocin